MGAERQTYRHTHFFGKQSQETRRASYVDCGRTPGLKNS